MQTYEIPPQVLRLVPLKNRQSTIGQSVLAPVERRSNVGDSLQSVFGGTKPNSKPASKPADPAFKNALRQRPLRIGLRYIGD